MSTQKMYVTNKKLKAENGSSPYSTVISYLNCNEEYEFNNFLFKDYSGIKTKSSSLDKHHIKDVVGTDVYLQIRPYLQKALSGEEQQFEFEWGRSPNTEAHIFSVTYTPDLDDNGKTRGVHITSYDMTGQRHTEDNFKTLFEASPNAIIVISSSGEIVMSNKQASSLFSYTQEEIMGMNIETIIPVKSNETLKEFCNNISQNNDSHDRHNEDHFYGLSKDGVKIPIELALTPISQMTDSGSNILCTITDIADRQHNENELLKLSRAVEASSSMVVITDLNGDIEYLNPMFSEITGYSKQEAVGANINILNSEETRKDAYADLWKTIASGKIWKGEFHNQKKDGSLYWDRASISCVRDHDGEITNYICIQEDVTHEYELSEQLSFQASHDALTGLINRREFERRAERLLSTIRQDKTEHAMCFMDLDQFKIVNDTCGHNAGDELLRQLSTVLQHEVRKRDTLARLGGDEFAILMEHCSLNNAQRLANTLLKTVQDFQFSWEGNTFKIGVSIGLVAIKEDMTNLTEVLKEADASCYMAKDAGRNQIHVYKQEDAVTTQRQGEMQWVARIYQALEENRFCLFAQSILSLDDSGNSHYELLIRMKEKNGKIIPPGAFLPGAERYNLISKIDRWVIKNAFDALTKHHNFLNHTTFVSINLSGQSLADKDFFNFVIDQFDESNISGEKICFEITETAAIANLTTAMKFINTFKGLGCKFALDDFGSGLSSFGYLKNLPVDYLKIDGMFVKDIIEDPIDLAMVKSINEIGHVMGMQTIAEFVENDNIKNTLNKIGVDFAQGYGIDKPIPLEEILYENVDSVINY